MELDELHLQRTHSPKQQARMEELERLQSWLLLLVMNGAAAAQGYGQPTWENK